MKAEEKKTADKAVSIEKDFYIGEAIDTADKDKVDRAVVKERTETLNNNPRDNSIDE